MIAAMENGCIVSIPYGDCNKYDQIWDINKKLLRVQIKTARSTDNKLGILFNCYSVSNGKKRKYTKDDIDYFATIWNNKCYLIPVEECSTEKTLWLELSPYNYSKCCLAQNYELEEVLKNI